MKPKILFVNHSSGLSGAPISCFNIMTHIKDDFIPLFATKEEGPLILKLKERGIKTYIVNPKFLYGLPCIIKFIKIINDNKINLIHLNSLTNICKYAGIAGYIMKVPIIWVVREDPMVKRSQKLKFWLKKIASKIIFVDHDTRLKLLGNEAQKKVEVIPNGIDVNYFKPEKSDFLNNLLKIDHNYTLIGFIGTIIERKGVKYLTEAFRDIKTTNNAVKLIIIGTYKEKYISYFKEIKKMVYDYSLENDIHFTGSIENVKDAINSLDIIVLPSLDERCSRTLLECIACAKPIIATNVGGNPEIIKDGFNGILIEPKNFKQIAHALNILITNKNMRNELGSYGRKLAENNFDLKININKMRNIYRQFSKNKN